MKFAVDTGGTFTDLVVQGDNSDIRLYKSATTPDDPAAGVLATFELAARDIGIDRAELLDRGDMFIYGTTRSTNAIVTGTTAKTAFLTTDGHPDILVIREGGKTEPFNFTMPYPKPYVPRSLTFEVPERLAYDGAVVEPLDEMVVIAHIRTIERMGVEAVAVCFLWSMVNPIHELRVAQLLKEHLPGVPYTLSHVLNPSLREYRRASSACIDASLKPLLGAHLRDLESRLREAGFHGRVLMITSQGGVMEAMDMARTPIHSVNSGPAMAPVAGRFYAEADAASDTVVVTDTGGTTFDVSLVRKGRIPWTRETWIGQPYLGDMTGFPSVDVKSIGAGGGSIAWVDEGGLLHVGPQSAGAVPGPVCYGQGGIEPTVTDAAVVVGYIDPGYFLGGAMALDKEAAVNTIRTRVAERLDLMVEEAAAAVLNVMSENMVHAIEDITVNQGIDPRNAVLVGGGGAAGLNAAAIARRLGCRLAVIPDVAAALSAAGALMSDLRAEFSTTQFTTSDGFDFDSINGVLQILEGKCREFIEGPGADSKDQAIEFTAEARYPHQIWEIEIPVRDSRFSTEADVAELVETFHATHDDMFAISDPGSPIEIVSWRANVRCGLRDRAAAWSVVESDSAASPPLSRRCYFSDIGTVDAPVLRLESMARNVVVEGPALIESSFTTLVIEPGATAVRRATGSLIITPAS